MFWKNERERGEFLLVFAAVLWIIALCYASSLFISARNVGNWEDQHFWFTLQNPDGGNLSYPFLAIWLLKSLHLLSGENPPLFAQISSLACLFAFLCTLAIFLKMGVPLEKLLLLSLILQPQLEIVLQRLDIFAIALSLIAFWLFYCGKRMEGWLALLAGIFLKVLPIFFAPLFLAMELRDFNRKSAARIAAAALISIIAFFAFPENLSTALFSSARGIQVESIYSNILLLLNPFLNLGIYVEYNYGSYNLALPAALSFLPLFALFLQAFAVLALSALFWKEGAKKERLLFYALLIAFAMVIPSKMLSNQFVLWPLFFSIPVLALGRKGKGPGVPAALPVLFYCLSVATLFVYPFAFGQLISLDPIGILLLTLRDSILIFLFIHLLTHRNEFHFKTDSK